MIWNSGIITPIYLGKPKTEVWRADCKRKCSRERSLNWLKLFVQEHEKDKK